MTLRDQLDTSRLPQHIAIIMDGNGRWARQRGKERVFGHQRGAQSVREVIEASAELGIKYLTLYAFSTENWNRPDDEISALMGLMVQSLNDETGTLVKNHISLRVIGDLDRLGEDVRRRLKETISLTSQSTGMVLIVALSYSSRWEILNATRSICSDVLSGKIKTDSIDEELYSQYLGTGDFPDPELMIRTSGELRISNFLLWQLAYTELYFTETLWPDFGKNDLYRAIDDFQKRERRFGKTSEQISDNI
jgi:undecaprenyl diphosphate synthase